MANCAQCQSELAAGQEILIKDSSARNAPFHPYCSICATDKEKQIQLETEDVNYFGALLLGAAAGILGGLIWYAVVVLTNTQIGYLAVGVGFLVGVGVVFGAGKKRGLPLQLMSAGITLGAMALGEYFTVRHFIVELKRAQGHRHFPLLYPLEDVIEFIKAGISSDPLTLLFWVFALIVAFSHPARRKLVRKDPFHSGPSMGG
jgi:hypothetical protein